MTIENLLHVIAIHSCNHPLRWWCSAPTVSLPKRVDLVFLVFRAFPRTTWCRTFRWSASPGSIGSFQNAGNNGMIRGFLPIYQLVQLFRWPIHYIWTGFTGKFTGKPWKTLYFMGKSENLYGFCRFSLQQPIHRSPQVSTGWPSLAVSTSSDNSAAMVCRCSWNKSSRWHSWAPTSPVHRTWRTTRQLGMLGVGEVIVAHPP